MSTENPVDNSVCMQILIVDKLRVYEQGNDCFLTHLAFQTKSREGSSRKWCKRRGLEEQRFYEMSKLKRQFEQLLQDHRLLDPEERDEEEYERDREEDKRRELKKLKRDHRKSSRKTKMLKLDQDEQTGSENEATTDIRDLEFKLTHNLDKLQAGSTARRSFTLREINLLKIILCSGLYPNLAIPDEGNTGKRDSEQLFHSQSKQFLLVHPTSVFVTRPDLLQPADAPVKQTTSSSKTLTEFSSNHQLLAFVSLLETNKPYLVNAMRVPALQTLLLFARSLDTNANLTRFVIDCWLEISLPDSATGQKVLTAVQQLRVTWSRLLKLRFGASKDIEMLERKSASWRNKERDLEHLLAKKLSEFLDSDVRYSLRRLLPSESQHLYFGPDRQVPTEGDSDEVFPFTAGSEPHPIKGGFRVNEYLTYNCLQDTIMAEAASAAAQYITKHWRCEKCGEKMLVTVLERLQHQEECQHDEPVSVSESAVADLPQSQTRNKALEVDSAVQRLRKPYYCNTCEKEFSFTSTEILKHKKSHVS